MTHTKKTAEPKNTKRRSNDKSSHTRGSSGFRLKSGNTRNNSKSKSRDTNNRHNRYSVGSGNRYVVLRAHLLALSQPTTGSPAGVVVILYLSLEKLQRKLISAG